MSAVEQFRLQLERIQGELDAATEQYHDALKSVSPVQVGDVLVSPRKGRAQVTGLHVRYRDEVSLYGRLILKTGKLHANERVLHPWDNWRKEK